MLDLLRQDLTFGLRAMVRAPLTAGAAIVSLALGAVAAALEPALRAARVESVWALRAD